MTQPENDPDPWFTSRRERRLWAWALLVTGAIALGLVLGPVLADLVRERELLDAVFGLGLLLVGATVVALAIRARVRGIELGVALAAVAVCLLFIARAGLSPAERTHLIEYAVLAALVYEALIERTANGRPLSFPAAIAIAGTSLIGVLDECVQAFLPDRVVDLRDVLFNGLAAVVAVAASAALKWISRRSES